MIELTKNYKKIKWLIQNDRQFFFEYFLSHYDKTEGTPVGELHSKWFRLLSKHDKLGIIAPREHSKSSIINLADNLFDICNGYEPYIVIFSDTPEQAIEHLANIVIELESNDKIIKWFGKLYEKRIVGDRLKEKWTSNTIETTNNVKVIARGWRFKARGMRRGADRPSKIVIDDVENDIDVNSSTMREKLKKTFERKILNLGSKNTKYRIVGTILHFDSLLQNEYNDPRPNWHWEFHTAIKEDNTALWPEWWSMERLEERRAEIGPIPFQQEFLNSPLDPSTQIIVPKAFYDRIDLTMCENYGYIDLAISEKETADYTAIVTIARHKTTGKLYVIDPVRIRGDILSQLDLVFAQHEKYNYVRFGVESVAYQKAFFQLLREESAKREIYLPVLECEIDRDKVRRALQITPHIENETILFNNSYQDFMAECIQFPKGAHDDYVDAFVGAVGLAVTSSSTSPARSGRSNIYPTNY